MDRSDRGTKRICPATGKKFYDLNRDPVISPYTGEVVPLSAGVPFTRGAAPALSKADAEEDEPEAEGAELVSLDEVESEEADTDPNRDAEGDDDLTIEDDADDAADDTLIVDEDDDNTSDLVDVENDDED